MVVVGVFDRSWLVPFWEGGDVDVGKDVMADVGERWVFEAEKEERVGDAIVVLRPMDSVSVSGAEGGGGREERRGTLVGERRVARQRKHSPVP